MTVYEENLIRSRNISPYESFRKNCHLSGMNSFHVYIMASKRNGTLYIGFTSSLAERLNKHKMGFYSGFCKKYNVNKLVYFEKHISAKVAIQREKRLKKWRRDWKIKLIEEKNPYWHDLYTFSP